MVSELTRKREATSRMVRRSGKSCSDTFWFGLFLRDIVCPIIETEFENIKRNSKIENRGLKIEF